MMNQAYHRRICTIVPIIIAISILRFTHFVGGDGITNSTPGHHSTTRGGRDAQLQLDTLKSTTTSLPPRNTSTDNPLKSRFKKPNIVLTLSLRPKTQLRYHEKQDQTSGQSSTALMTSKISDLTQASFVLPSLNNTRKPYSVLDRLRKLTNNKMKRFGSTGTDYGFKNHPNSFDEQSTEDESEKKEEKVDLVDPENSQITKVGGHLSHNPPSSESKSKPTVTVIIQSNVPVETTISPTTPDEKIGSPSNQDEIDQIEQGETRYITADQIGGNRPTKMPFHFTTSTTTEAVTTPYSTKRPIKRYRKAHSPHNHIYAPTQDPINIAHNEDDLTVQDVQDYRAAHLTFGSKVGTGRGTERPTETIPAPPSQKVELATKPTVSRIILPPRGRSPPPKKTTVHPQSASSGVKNSHIKIKPSADSINDNLPFYKEPGGIFEHKYPDNDNEPNEVNQQFNERSSPSIKYAPNGPSIQPQSQQHVYNSNGDQLGHHQQNLPPLAPQHLHSQQQRHFTGGPVSSPQYLTVTQQPVYLAPVPVQHLQPAYNNYQPHNPAPQQNYYPQQQYYPPQQPLAPPPAQHPHPQQQYVQNQPAYNQHQPVNNHPARPGYPVPYTPAQPVYSQPGIPNNNPNRFLHIAQPQTTPDYASQNIYNPPPSRYDPASDYFYGDPRPPPKHTPKPEIPRSRPVRNRVEDYEEKEKKPKKQGGNRGSNRKSSRDKDRGSGRDRDEEGDAEDEDEEEYSNKPAKSSPRKNSPRNNQRDDHDDDDEEESDRGGGGRGREPPPRRQNKRPNNYDDYDSDPNENIGEVVRPAVLSERAYNDQTPNREFVSLDANFGGHGGQFVPSTRDNSFRPSPPDNGPNFEHPNIAYPARGAPTPQHQRQEQRSPQNRQDNFGNDDDRFDTRHPPLDPIYTRTLQQYDEENTASRVPDRVQGVQPEERYPPPPYDADEDEQRPPPRPRERPRERRPPPRPPPEEEEEEEPEEGHRGNSNSNRGRERDPPPQKEEEEEEERPRQSERNRKPQQNDEEEEEQPAEEEEEQKPEEEPEEENTQEKPQEEEEEEEEEEDDNSKRRKSKRQQEEEKKPPPEKPKPEKSGHLDDDISAIEKEFGFTVPKVEFTLR